MAQRDGFTVNRTTTQVWESDSVDTPTTLSITEQSADGLRSWGTIRGLTTASVTVFDGSGGRTVTTTAPDGVATVQTYLNDRLQSQITTAGGVQISSLGYAYDPHGRLASSTDARNGTTSYAYFADDQIQSVTTPDPDPTQSGPGYDPQTTTYLYDSAGRLSQTTQPDGGIVTTSYYPTGQQKRISGARTYPVEYTYDPQGRVKTMTTWQDFAGNGGTAVTTWNYDPQRGWLLNKRYADNTGLSYTYKPSGRLLARTWARGIVCTYSYNAAGDLTSIDYSDSTPDVTITPDRTGRPKTITDGSGTRTLSYHASGQLEDEAYTAGLLNGLSVDRTFDSLSRLSGLSVPLGSPEPGGGGSVNSVTYAYDAASRLDTVTSGTNTATYSYVSNSPLVGGLVFKQSGTTRLTTTKVYGNLNRLASISSVPSASSVVSASYVYNSANQRTRATREDGAYWDYGYDSLGQVTSAKKHLSSAVPVNGLDHAWMFDDIGNRKTATINGSTSVYTASSLNQYSQRTVPGILDVFGAATPDATVTVTYPASGGTIFPTTRQGEQFYKQLTVDNASTDQYASVKITGVKNLVGPNGEDAVTEEIRSLLVSGTPEVFTHDADGNLTSDARWTYTWDGENRLIAIEISATAEAAGVPKKKLEFAYDGQSRRIAKKVYDWVGSAWTLNTSLRFIYDGWNLLAELDDASIAVRTHVWGLDLSGSFQGAGGVGGLLFANLGSATHATAFDGNGNIIGLVDQTTGAKSAEFEYGVFGETLKTDGPAADAMPFRFSTKYQDTETGLLYYGFRYYDPSTGRWLSRDPLEEEGGINVYQFVANGPTTKIDPDGAEELTIHIYFNQQLGGAAYRAGLRQILTLRRNLEKCARFGIQLTLSATFQEPTAIQDYRKLIGGTANNVLFTYFLPKGTAGETVRNASGVKPVSRTNSTLSHELAHQGRYENTARPGPPLKEDGRIDWSAPHWDRSHSGDRNALMHPLALGTATQIDECWCNAMQRLARKANP